MKIGIVNASPYIEGSDGRIYMSPDEQKSLSQWFHIFNDVVLLRPRLAGSDVPAGGLPAPQGVAARPICTAGAPGAAKRRQIREAAGMVDDVDWLYYRLPNFESLWFWQAVAPTKPYFTELHGDMEQAIMAGRKPWLVKKVFSQYFLRRFRKMASGGRFVLSIGPALLEKYVHRADIPPYVTTNHLLCEADYPAQLPEKKRDDVWRLLFVGHIHPRKGLIYLFEALRMLHDEGVRFSLTLAGRGELTGTLESFAHKHGFSDDVCFVGQVPHGEQLFRLYREADLFVLPSVAAEGVPRVTHEAMAFGCPVVATDIGSVRWQLNDGCGMVVPPRSAAALRRAIADVMTDGTLYDGLRQKGFERSRAFSLEKQEAGIHRFVRQQLETFSIHL